MLSLLFAECFACFLCTVPVLEGSAYLIERTEYSPYNTVGRFKRSGIAWVHTSQDWTWEYPAFSLRDSSGSVLVRLPTGSLSQVNCLFLGFHGWLTVPWPGDWAHPKKINESVRMSAISAITTSMCKNVLSREKLRNLWQSYLLIILYDRWMSEVNAMTTLEFCEKSMKLLISIFFRNVAFYASKNRRWWPWRFVYVRVLHEPTHIALEDGWIWLVHLFQGTRFLLEK